MDVTGLNLEDAMFSVNGRSTCLLRDEREGVGFIKKPELSTRVPFGRRIQEDPAFEQGAMKIGDERAYVTRTIFTA
jgi:hypothetical protein